MTMVKSYYSLQWGYPLGYLYWLILGITLCVDYTKVLIRSDNYIFSNRFTAGVKLYTLLSVLGDYKH